MSLHDAYARRTPFELAFEERSVAEELAGRIEEEASARGADPSDPISFLTLGSVAEFVRRVEGPDTPAEARDSFALLLYHAVHFVRAGYPLYLLTTQAAHYLVEGVPGHDVEPVAEAGYLQLPQHLFWAEDGAPAAPESVDGIFWTVTPAGSLQTLIASGLRPDRPGFAVLALPQAPLAEAGDWLDAGVRPDGPDFESALPGGELDRLHAFRAAGEVLKFLARFFAYVRSVPGAVEAGEAASEAEGPAASRLPYHRVVLTDA